jgi:hypothetical protein
LEGSLRGDDDGEIAGENLSAIRFSLSSRPQGEVFLVLLVAAVAR